MVLAALPQTFLNISTLGAAPSTCMSCHINSIRATPSSLILRSQSVRLLLLRCLPPHWMPSLQLYALPYPDLCVANLIRAWIALILVAFLPMNLVCTVSPGPSRMLPNWTMVPIILHLTPCNAIPLVIFINLLLLLPPLPMEMIVICCWTLPFLCHWGRLPGRAHILTCPKMRLPHHWIFG